MPVAVGPAKAVTVKVMKMAPAAEAVAAAVVSIPKVHQKSLQDSQSLQEATFRSH